MQNFEVQYKEGTNSTEQIGSRFGPFLGAPCGESAGKATHALQRSPRRPGAALGFPSLTCDAMRPLCGRPWVPLLDTPLVCAKRVTFQTPAQF